MGPSPRKARQEGAVPVSGDAAALRSVSLRISAPLREKNSALFSRQTKKAAQGRVTSTRAVSKRRDRRRPADLAAERRDEEEDQRDREHVDDQRLDQHETENQRAADVARRAGIPRNRFHG